MSVNLAVLRIAIVVRVIVSGNRKNLTILRTSGNQALVQKITPFANWLKTKPADITSLQNWKRGQTVSFLSEETDIASFLNAFAKSAKTEIVKERLLVSN